MGYISFWSMLMVIYGTETSQVKIQKLYLEVCVEVNTEKFKYNICSRLVTRMQDNRNIKAAKTSFENVAKFKQQRATVTNQNYIHEEIKSRLNSEKYLLPLSSETFVFSSPFKEIREGKTSRGRHRSVWEGNIKIDLK
jgi:hypothetical protein